MRHIERTLSEIYKAGIVSTEGLDKLQEDSTASIMVIDDKLANQRATEQLYSVKEAYSYLLTADTVHYSPHILRQCALNEYLYPNLTYDEQRTETARKEILDNYAWANGIVVSGQKSSTEERSLPKKPTTSSKVCARNPSSVVNPSDKKG